MSGRLPPAEAGFLSTPSGAIFAAYQPPSAEGGGRRHAVLICEPLGPDRMNLHLAHRALAQRLAAEGFATLRFDPRGTADSSGSPRDAQWPAGWWDDAAAAANYVRERSGAPRLAAFGARFGGTLAATLADVDTLMLWGPDLDGRSFLRREKALSRMVAANPAGRLPEFAAAGDEEYLGYLYTASARETLRGVSALERAPGQCKRARVVAWDDDSPDPTLATRLEAQGVAVDFDRPVGFDSDDSLDGQAVPEPLLDDLADWLCRVDRNQANPSEGEAKPGKGKGTALAPSARVDRGQPRPGGVEEEVVRFGPGEALFGIVTRPSTDRARPDRPGVVLINGGNNHRPGINRNYTEWARDAGQAGLLTLRFDIRGLGDSPPERPEDLNRLYRMATRQDVVAAIDWTTTHSGAESVMLCGLCAGAFQAFHAARLDRRVRALVLLDLLCWDPGGPAGPAHGFWARRRKDLAQIRNRLPELVRPRTILARGLREITARGTDVLMVSCRNGGASLVETALEADRETLEASGRFRLEVLDDADHIFTPLWSQARVATLLADFAERLTVG